MRHQSQIHRRKAHLDFEQILPRRLRDTEHGDDTGSFELDDVLDIDALLIVSSNN